MRKFLSVLMAAVLLLSLMVPVASAEYVAIGKTTENLRLRKEASLSAKILITAPKGSSVAITQQDLIENSDGGWYAVSYNGEDGFMSADYLEVLEDGESVTEIGYICESGVRFRAEPNTDCEILRSFSKNTKVEITGTQDGWYSIRYGEQDGYVRCDLVTLANSGYSVGKTSSSSATNVSNAVAKDLSLATSTLDSVGATSKQREVVEKGLTLLGIPYKYGTNGPNSFDCSGFVSYVYKQCGISINRSSLDQYRFNGTAVENKSDLLPGDLVFFRDTAVGKNAVTHVGMYIGNGQFVHAGSGNSGAGRCVKVSDLNTGYYQQKYVGAKRII